MRASAPLASPHDDDEEDVAVIVRDGSECQRPNKLHSLVIFLHDWPKAHITLGQPPSPILMSHTLRFVGATEANELIYAL